MGNVHDNRILIASMVLLLVVFLLPPAYVVRREGSVFSLSVHWGGGGGTLALWSFLEWGGGGGYRYS